MREPRYIELHAASAFSFLEGASQPEALIERAAELEMPELALLDRNGPYGAARFNIHAKEKKTCARIGAEISVSDFGFNRLQPQAWQPHQHRVEPPRVAVLCASQTGYQNLSQLITRYKMREAGKAEGAATLSDLEEFAPGLIALTGGEEGPLAAALATGGESVAREAVERMVNLFVPCNVYVELQRHGERAEEARNQAALRIAESLRLPVLATNGVRYARGEDREILDVFTAIRHGTSLEHAGRLLCRNSQRSLRSPRTMQHVFNDLPEALANTVYLAQRPEFKLDQLGYGVSDVRRWRQRHNGYVSTQAGNGGGGSTVQSEVQAKAYGARFEAGGTGAEADRIPEVLRLLPNRVGHRGVLPPARHHGAGTGERS